MNIKQILFFFVYIKLIYTLNFDIFNLQTQNLFLIGKNKDLSKKTEEKQNKTIKSGIMMFILLHVMVEK